MLSKRINPGNINKKTTWDSGGYINGRYYMGCILSFYDSIQVEIKSIEDEKNATVKEINFNFRTSRPGTYNITFIDEKGDSIFAKNAPSSGNQAWAMTSIRADPRVSFIKIINFDSKRSEDTWVGVSDYIGDYYIDLVYEYNKPQSCDSLNPNKTTLNPRAPINFTWNSKINQKAFELQYRVNGANWNVITKNTSERFYDLPPGTIREPSGTVEWKIRVMEDSGIYSDWTEASFTIGTVSQPAPRLSSPVGDYIKNGKPITFKWDFVKNTVEEQKAYEIEISLPNETKTIKETSSNASHTVDLKITDSIVVYWKMRVQNNFDEWSNWTDRVSFQTIGIPPAPQIMSIDNSNRPTVKWNSREQEAFKLSVEDMKGNVVFITKDILGATVREFKIDKVIPNGKYLFKLSILNSYAIYSEITEYTHIIEPTPIEKPTITIYKSDYFVEVTSDYLDGEVLRDGRVIGKLKDGKFRDYTGANYKTYSYQIRAFKDDVVGLSDKKGCVTEFGEFNTLATVDKLDDFFLIKYGLNESIKKVYSFEVQGVAINLEGKKYPFYEFDNHAKASFNLSFYLENMDQVIKLQSLVEKKKEFLLRENRGTNRQGTIQGVNVEYDVLGYLVTCTLIITGEDYE